MYGIPIHRLTIITVILAHVALVKNGSDLLIQPAFLNYILGILVALLINRKGTKFKSFWRFIFILSIAIPQFVSLLIIRSMLAQDGIINVVLKNAGWISKSLPFFTNATWARMTVIIVNLWIGIPYTILQVTGILQNIPMELYEAADVDGANGFVKFFKITMPYMLFVTTPYLITTFTANVNNFNIVYLLTRSEPSARNTNVIIPITAPRL